MRVSGSPWCPIFANLCVEGQGKRHAPRRMDSFSQNKPRKISLKNKRLLDDYLFTSICFWEHWFPLENKLRFLNFPVGAGGVVVQKKPPNFSLLIFHREPPRRGFTALLGLP